MRRPHSIVPGRTFDPDAGGTGCNAGLLTRRTCVALGASAVFLKMSAQAAAISPSQGTAPALLPDQTNLIVGGPENGPLAGWAHLLGAAIGQRVGAPDQSLRIAYVGGADGVTAANQFEARTVPDGSTALLVSGSAAMAWLIGDQRAQFDAGHWLPVATGLASGVVLRAPPMTTSATATSVISGVPGRRLLLAASGAADLAVAATLGLSMLGIETQLVVDTDEPLTTMRNRRADLVFLRGPNAVDATAAARALGATPIFSLGVMDDAGSLIRDPQIADIPTLLERLATRPSASYPPGLLPAWRAVAASAQLEFALVLPWLTPSGTVSQWRKAVSQINATARADTAAEAMLRVTQSATLRLQTDHISNFGLSAIAADANTLLELRRWMAARLP